MELTKEDILSLGLYILEGTTPVQTTDIEAWARSRQSGRRRVDYTVINEIAVSTVFLGIDQRAPFKGKPILFETMIFGLKDLNDYQERYSTWEDAEAGHLEACEQVKKMLEGNSKLN